MKDLLYRGKHISVDYQTPRQNPRNRYFKMGEVAKFILSSPGRTIKLKEDG